nr:hypothetical protein [Brevibacillus laterosporus]
MGALRFPALTIILFQSYPRSCTIVNGGDGTVQTITMVIAVVALVISIAAFVQAVKNRK